MRSNPLPKLLLLLAFASIAFAQESGQTYTAYSLTSAMTLVESAVAQDIDFRTSSPELFRLDGITVPLAIVADRQRDDWILIGKRDPRYPALTLDDWVVALRSRLLHAGVDPGVSIDSQGDGPGPNTKRVTFSGGIDNTRFGQACLEADVLIKQIALGLDSSPAGGVETYHQLLAEEALRYGWHTSEVTSQFWFYPGPVQVSVFDNLAFVEQSGPAVFTHVLSATINGEKVSEPNEVLSYPGERFASSVLDNYGDLETSYESLRAVPGLNRLVGLARGLTQMSDNRGYSYWLREYALGTAETTAEVEVVASHSDAVDSSVSGGLRLAAAIIRTADPATSAFEEHVIQSRGDQTLAWDVAGLAGSLDRPIGRAIPDGSERRKLGQLLPTWAQALFLLETGRYRDAIALVDKLIDYAPEWAPAYLSRGAAYAGLEDQRAAILDFDVAIEANPTVPEGWFARGRALADLTDSVAAIRDFDRAVDLNPAFARAFLARGNVHYEEHRLDLALADFDRTIGLDSNNAAAYFQRGSVLAQVGRHNEAVDSFNRVIDLNPDFTRAYLSKAMVLDEQKRIKDAVAAYEEYLNSEAPAVGEEYNWRDYARTRAQELLVEINLPTAYSQSHGGVPLSERLNRVRSRLSPKQGAKE